ncbi:putative TOS1-like glycosyl hydrolase-domain-containing protein [Coniochaeta sp. 2T2.1]|nr:putative TOS1-like glycosyl hydrolase-domain-containing protein [Coniochaeta sp. 2T2.1]
MKVASGIALLASAGFASAATMGSRPDISRRAAQTSQELCASKGTTNENFNYFCAPVSQIKYTGVGGPPGTYDKVVFMDPETGRCDKVPQPYSGPLGPLAEPMAWFARGPTTFKQFAYYTPGSNEKRETVDSPVAKRHGHKHARFQHKHAHLHSEREAPKEVEKRVDWVVATINGQVVSWENNYFGPETPAAAAPAAATAPPAAAAPSPEVSTPAAPVANPSPNAVAGIQAGAYVKPTSAPAPPKPSPAPITGDYVRKARYDSKAGIAEGLVFLANKGGQGSGAWSPKFGNTLSYVDSTGTKGASSPQILGDVQLPSGNEFAIYSDVPCNGDNCGYANPGTVNYMGFAGADKVFLLEFGMPHEPVTGGPQDDMPAYWMLHHDIARTSQYSDCSSWQSGGGEFDVLEVLAPGDNKCKSTIHANAPGGDPNYFDRPTEGTMKVAVVFDSASSSLSIKVLPSSYEFPASLSAADVQDLLAADGGARTGNSLGASLFAITS